MHAAGLQRGGGKYHAQSLGHAIHAVGDDDQDVGDTARLDVVEDLHPELGALDVLDPRSEDVARAIGQHAQSVNGS